jgi:hypothetical protein
MMDNLLVCSRCKHGAPLHTGGGCETRRCDCTATIQDIINDGCEAAKVEMRRQWEAWESPG